MSTFKRMTATALIASIGLAGFTGCQTMNEHRTATGAVAGTLVGAAAGAAIDKDNRGRGALIGGAAGAVVGGGIGYYLQRQKDKFDRMQDVETSQNTIMVQPPPPASAPGAPPPPLPPPVEREALTLRLPGDILFPLGSSALSPAGTSKINEIAQVLKEYPESDVIVRGYTSSDGDDRTNYDLSIRRAEVVRNQIISAGVYAGRIQALGFGESNPIADNNTEAGRQRNRRVEIDVVPRDSAQ